MNGTNGIPPEIMEKMLKAYVGQGQDANAKKAKETKDKRSFAPAGPYRMEEKPLWIGSGQEMPYKPGKPDIMEILGRFGQGSISGPGRPVTAGDPVQRDPNATGSPTQGQWNPSGFTADKGPGGEIVMRDPRTLQGATNPLVPVPGPRRRPVTGPPQLPVAGENPPVMDPGSRDQPGGQDAPPRGPVRGPVAAPQKPPVTGTSYHGGPDSIYNRAITSQRPTAAGRKW